MHNLIRYYNQNRKKVWLVIAIVAFALILLRTINNIVAEQKRLEEENKVENTIVDVQSSMSEDYAIMSDEKIEEDVKEENTDIIDKFFKACNLKNIEEAYNMLSDACKEVKYPTLESFENTYYNTIFTTQRSFDKEAWMEKNDAYTYRMAIIEDPLATGQVSYSDSFQDFYTVVKQGQDLKLIFLAL